MLSKIFIQYPYGSFSALGLLIFIALFAAMLGWLSRRGAKGFYSRLASMPLKELEPLKSKELEDGL